MLNILAYVRPTSLTLLSMYVSVELGLEGEFSKSKKVWALNETLSMEHGLNLLPV